MKTEMIIALGALSAVMVSCQRQKPQAENVIKVKTMSAVATASGNEETYSGTVEENSGISLSFPVGGTVRSVNVSEGQNVGAGTLEAVLDATTLGNLAAASQAGVGQAQAGLARAEKAAAQALDAYNRMKQLHDRGSLPDIKWVESQTQYRQALDAVAQARAAVESAKAQKNISQKDLRDTRLYAPRAGYISKKLTEAGQNVAPGQQGDRAERGEPPPQPRLLSGRYRHHERSPRRAAAVSAMPRPLYRCLRHAADQDSGIRAERGQIVRSAACFVIVVSAPSAGRTYED